MALATRRPKRCTAFPVRALRFADQSHPLMSARAAHSAIFWEMLLQIRARHWVPEVRDKTQVEGPQ